MASKIKKEKNFEEALWESCNALRGSVEPSEYKHIVLSLIFLKFANDKFYRRRNELIEEGKEQYIEIREFYSMKNIFYIPEETIIKDGKEEIRSARWEYIMANAKQSDIAIKIDTALSMIEKNNPSLNGALPDNYYSRLNLDVTKLASLLDEINKINTIKNEDEDIIGRVYEFFLKKFALQEGKGKGEFYTPKCVVNLIAELIQPYKGKIYDPACGSGGMFVQSMKFVEKHHGNKKDISIYGQEYISTTRKLAKMNLAIRGISADLGEIPADTFSKDQHKDLKADFIMANPPFNQSKWRGKNELEDDERWNGYITPPLGNANYGWILNMVSKLSQNGVAGFLLANGSLSGDGDELTIRKKLIENKLVDCILYLPRNLFYTTDIGVSLWIISRNRKKRIIEIDDKPVVLRDRENEILFIDLRKWGSPFEKKYIELTDCDDIDNLGDIQKITKTYHDWQSIEGYKNYKDIPEYCKAVKIHKSDLTTKENEEGVITIEERNWSLVPSEYIEFINQDENIDFDERMNELQSELKKLLVKDEQSKKELLQVLKDLGYEIKFDK